MIYVHKKVNAFSHTGSQNAGIVVHCMGSNHFPIVSSMSLGNYLDTSTSLPFKFNGFHLVFEDCCTLMTGVWNLEPKLHDENDWILWWESTNRRTIKLLRGWGKIVSRLQRRREKWVHWRLTKIHTFPEENIHIVTLEEEAAKE